jgi:hypothetical protein
MNYMITGASFEAIEGDINACTIFKRTSKKY